MSNAKPPSIVYVVSQYPAISHTFILAEVNGLKQSGLDIHVTSINQPDRSYKQLTAVEQEAYNNTTFVKASLLKKLPFYFIKTLLLSPKGFLLSLGRSLRVSLSYPNTCVRQLAYWLEAMVVADTAINHQAQQLHAHFSTQGCTVAMLASIMTGIPFSLTVHGPDEFYQVNEQQLQEKFLRAHFVICISDFARSQVMKFSAFEHWPKLHVNKLGVDTSQFYPNDIQQHAQPILLCVGRLVNAKGQGILIEAAKLLAERKIDFAIHFVGDGPDREALEKLVDEKALQQQITFLGKVNHDHIRTLQREADIFVLPSFAEGIPVVLMEAMASGTPCVTTQITGIPELFTHEKNGLLVPPGNAVLLADALQRLLVDRALHAAIAQAALITVEEEWCIHKSNERLAAIFRQQLSS